MAIPGLIKRAARVDASVCGVPGTGGLRRTRSAGNYAVVLLLLLPFNGAGAAEPLGLLTGTAEPHPVESLASARSDIRIAEDGSVSGTVHLSGTTATAVRIREAGVGEAGPLVLNLVNAQVSTWVVPEGARLSVSQLAAFKAGSLYVTVISKRHPRGELRIQLRPPTDLLTDSDQK
jgi:hypothetical protein